MTLRPPTDRQPPVEIAPLIPDALPKSNAPSGRVPAPGARETPAMRQYFGFKKQRPDCVLFFRMGDFYELFDEDAVIAHKALGLTLTERTPGLPMAGVPFHSAEGYFRRMLEAGHRVAVCEQMQDPKEAKGVVERDVTRVLTPGTLVDETLLSDERPSALAAIHLDPSDDTRAWAAVVDLSTGAFVVLDSAAHELAAELARRAVTEALYPEPPAPKRGSAEGPVELAPTLRKVVDNLRAAGVSLTARPSWQFRPGEALESLREQFGVATLAGFGLTDDEPATLAAGAAVRYLHETQPVATRGGARLAHLAPPRRERADGAVTLDLAAMRALEIERTIRSGRSDGSLLGVFLSGSGCRTGMGRRMLRDWLCAPLARREAIESRLRRVATLVEDRRSAGALGEAVAGVQDVARIGGRLGAARATARDLVALGKSLGQIDAILSAIEHAPAFNEQAGRLRGWRATLAPLSQEIGRSCVDAPPAHLREGGLFRDGVDAELDEARMLQRDATTWLGAYQTRLSREHELPGIKVGFNKVFGYYIELPAAQARRAPAALTRKQTLKNAERYTTPELAEFESKVLSAESRAIEREQRLFESLCARAAALAPTLALFALEVGGLDALLCFADRAVRKGWTRPEIVDEPTLDFTQARHPVLEELLGTEFVPNDVRLATADQPAGLALITGPNMAGKSTYIRTAALVALLAHCGSFVPAERATVGLVDRIFTRVGAEDALAQGQSTFMVEMTETASILHHCTPRSLVILDEIGRGTSTLDGLSLAWAVAERLAEGTEARRHGGTEGEERGSAGRGPRTLFATHYHELTTLEESMPGRVTNLHVAVREWGDSIVFLHRILAGRTDKSYGVHVARLAGMPDEVVRRARELLEQLSVTHEGAPPAPPAAAPSRDDPPQLRLFVDQEHPAVEALRGLDMESLTPLKAFDELRRLKGMAEGG